MTDVVWVSSYVSVMKIAGASVMNVDAMLRIKMDKRNNEIFKETNRGTGKGRDTVPVTKERGQAERDSSAVRVANLHSPRQR